MKLSLESIRCPEEWAGFHLPAYDPLQVAEQTKKQPQWLHFGPGNIFRIFPAALCQRLLEQGQMQMGIVCCEGYDEEVVTRCLRPFDNLTVGVTMHADGSTDKEVIASLVESLTLPVDMARVRDILASPSLQMVSFTITEKGYSLRGADHELLPVVAADMAKGPEGCASFMAQLTALLVHRGRSCQTPVTLVSMDNCSRNGEKLQNAVMEIAQAWLDGGHIAANDMAFIKTQVAFPWTMIDKITPRPNETVERSLAECGLEDAAPIITAKNTYTAPFVNAEKAQYLVVEDWFPNGRPALEKAGVIFTTRSVVNQVEKMKVSTCLNPLHTCLAIYGCLLGHTLIADEMRDPQLARFIQRMSSEEGMPYVTDPGVIAPAAFLAEVLNERLPNPFMPDTPQRIATDTSQKLAVRFGETIKAAGSDAADFSLIPLVIAGWLRYLLGVDDEGHPMELSPDPLLPAMREKLAGIALGGSVQDGQIEAILCDEAIFGADLCACGLSGKIVGYLKELIAGPGAVRATLKKYVG